MINFKKKKMVGIAKVAENMNSKIIDKKMDNVIKDKKVKIRAFRYYMSFNKDLTPRYKSARAIVEEFIKKRIIVKSLKSFYMKKLQGWICYGKWIEKREKVKEMALEIAGKGFNFNLSVDIVVKKVLRDLKRDNVLFGDSRDGLRIMSDKAGVTAYLAKDALLVYKATSEVAKYLAQSTIDGRLLDVRDKLQMSAGEAHQLWASSQKALLQFIGVQSTPQMVINNSPQISENCGEKQIYMITKDAALAVIKDIDMKNQENKVGGNTRGYVIPEAPKNKDFDKFGSNGCEDAIIVGEEGFNKSGERS